MVNWKTFNSVKYQFTLKYPALWEVVSPELSSNFEESGSLEFISNKAPGEEMSLEALPSSATFEAQKESLKNYGWKNKVYSNIGVDGTNAFFQSGYDYQR